ncbi:MAG: ribonuclease III [Firmicutes bacterium]|nr:ribonuclease III [Bacillota bacterium]
MNTDCRKQAENLQETRLIPRQKLEVLQTNLGVRFQNLSLLEQALTHSSFSRQTDHKKDNYPDYERLEFLGDAVLELVTSRMLYLTYPYPEGRLTRMRAGIVCEESLSYVAGKYHLGDYLLLSQGEEKTGGRRRPSILCDVTEAIIGAVFLDQGLDEATALIERMVFSSMEELPGMMDDYKSVLQEHLQAKGLKPPVYEVVSEDGPPHDRTFTIKLHMEKREDIITCGHSKKQAEQLAAKTALQMLNQN